MTNFNFLLNNLSYLSSEDLVGRPMDSTCFRSAPVPPSFRLRLHPLRMVATLLLLLCLGVGEVWGTDGDTHDFSQSISQVLNNGVSISSINISDPGYPVKEVIVSWNYNKSYDPAVTISVTVGLTSFGSEGVGTSTTTTTSFKTSPQTSVSGAISISFTNHRTGSKGNGTFNVTNVRLVEGASAVATPYTVTFYKTDGSTQEITEASAGAGVTPPTMSTPCDGWAFQGWSKSQSTSPTSTTELTTVTLSGGKYYPSSDVTLYPVYTKSGGSVFARYSKVTSNPSDWSGTYLLAANTSGSTYYTFTGQNSSNDYGNSSSHTPGTTEKTSWEVVVAKTTNGYSIYHTNAKKYLGLTVDDNKLNFNSTFSATTYEWTLSYNNGAQSVNKTNRYIECNTRASYRVACYAGTQKRFFLYKRIEDPIIYYYSYPSCCTPLASINGSINLIQRKQSEMDFHLVIISVFQRSHYLPFGHLPFGNYFLVLVVALYFV